MSVRELWERRQARYTLIIGAIILALIGSTTAYGIVQGNSLRECNRRVIVALETRTSYSSTIQQLGDQRNAALLNILQAAGTNTQAADFLEALKVDTNWKQSRLALLRVFDPSKSAGSRQAVADAIKAYSRADTEQKKVTAQRDKVKLPKLADCL